MSLPRANEIRTAKGKAHEHTCTLCEPETAYQCTVRHRINHMTMLNVWYRCPLADHAGEKLYRECQAGLVILEHRP